MAKAQTTFVNSRGERKKILSIFKFMLDSLGVLVFSNWSINEKYTNLDSYGVMLTLLFPEICSSNWHGIWSVGT